MTFKEQEEQIEEWIKTLKVGDEVCITNRGNTIDNIIDNMFAQCLGANIQGEIVCKIEIIEGILSNGGVVVGDVIYNQEGQAKGHKITNPLPRLFPITDELKELAWKMKFSENIKNTEWSKFPVNTIAKIMKICNEAVKN